LFDVLFCLHVLLSLFFINHQTWAMGESTKKILLILLLLLRHTMISIWQWPSGDDLLLQAEWNSFFWVWNETEFWKWNSFFSLKNKGINEEQFFAFSNNIPVNSSEKNHGFLMW